MTTDAASLALTEPTIVLMFSGGIDSTAALWLLVREAELPVHTHHVELHNLERRDRIEGIVTAKILKWFRDRGHALTHSESTVAVPPIGPRFPWDNDVTKFVGGWLATNPLVDSVAFGVSRTDDESHGGAGFLERGNALFDAFTDRSKLIYPVRHLSKRECWESMPPDLRMLTWSCRRPIYAADFASAQPCGACKSCKQDREFRDA